MTLVDDILNGKHFPLGSRERLKATLVSLVLILAALIMVIDVYESILLGYGAMAWIEGISASVLFVTYLLFPRYISLQSTIYSAVVTLCFLIILSLTIVGAHPYFALFWLATLPIYIFFFLGLEVGMKWSVGVVFVLILTTLNSVFEWIPPLYQYEFLIQLTVGYIAISYLLYSLENERQEYENSLIDSVKEREVLLKEIHHRTKNNIQVMMALLDTQSFKIDDPKYKKMFRSHVDRLKTMALVHEHLYSGETYETVEIDKYLKEITDHWQSLTKHRISTDIENLVLNMKLAMNLGLVYNEALSNAIEHAYGGDEEGEIEVSLKRAGEKCVLSVKDYGEGFDATANYKTLGVTLMQDISRSLESNGMEIESENGTEIRIYCTLEGSCV